MRRFLLCSAVLLAFAFLAGCSRSPSPTAAPKSGAAVKVTDITLGRSLNSDKTIADKTNSFEPQDILYVSVETEGSAASAILKARWTYEDGQPVSESFLIINPTGTTVTEFHTSNPDGWPPGEYKVEVLLNDVSAGSREFEVE